MFDETYYGGKEKNISYKYENYRNQKPNVYIMYILIPLTCNFLTKLM